jgi:hypothetical protein
MTRTLTPFEQAVVLIAALILGEIIGFAYARAPGLIQPTPPAVSVRDKCLTECQRGCLPPEACTMNHYTQRTK